MLKEKDLIHFLSNEKKNLLSKVERLENPYEKLKLLEDFNNDVELIQSYYDKTIAFSNILQQSILDENPEIIDKSNFEKVVSDKLNVSWIKEEERFNINLDKSSSLLKDKEYLNSTIKVLDEIKDKLSKKVRAYYLKLDELETRGWSEF